MEVEQPVFDPAVIWTPLKVLLYKKHTWTGERKLKMLRKNAMQIIFIF